MSYQLVTLDRKSTYYRQCWLAVRVHPLFTMEAGLDDIQIVPNVVKGDDISNEKKRTVAFDIETEENNDDSQSGKEEFSSRRNSNQSEISMQTQKRFNTVLRALGDEDTGCFGCCTRKEATPGKLTFGKISAAVDGLKNDNPLNSVNEFCEPNQWRGATVRMHQLGEDHGSECITVRQYRNMRKKTGVDAYFERLEQSKKIVLWPPPLFIPLLALLQIVLFCCDQVVTTALQFDT